ncbi:hypothetical protein B0H10DRAFT_2037173, partial [Mycena sp. CBHHK59/15]
NIFRQVTYVPMLLVQPVVGASTLDQNIAGCPNWDGHGDPIKMPVELITASARQATAEQVRLETGQNNKLKFPAKTEISFKWR